MYSVDRYLRNVYNLQTKWKILLWLKQHDAAHSSIGLEVNREAFEKRYIY